MTTTYPDTRINQNVTLGAPNKPKITTHSIFGLTFGASFGCAILLTSTAFTSSLPRRGPTATDRKLVARAGATPGFGAFARPNPRSVAAATPGVAPARTTYTIACIPASSFACTRACISNHSLESILNSVLASNQEAPCP
jgi:hypothetical protein